LSRYTYVQDFIKLSAAVYEEWCKQKKNVVTMLKTIPALPSLRRPVIKALCVLYVMYPSTTVFSAAVSWVNEVGDSKL